MAIDTYRSSLRRSLLIVDLRGLATLRNILGLNYLARQGRSVGGSLATSRELRELSATSPQVQGGSKRACGAPRKQQLSQAHAYCAWGCFRCFESGCVGRPCSR